jgi:hypothetical protein
MEQSNTTVPLAYLALELGITVEELTARLDGEVVRDDVGMRAVTRETARRLIAEKAEEEERMEAWRRRDQAKLTAAVAATQAGILPGVAAPEGLESLAGPQLFALAAKQERLDAAGERFDELVSGTAHYHPINQQED